MPGVRSSPSSDSRKRRVRHARSDPVSTARSLTRHAARREADARDVRRERHHHPAKRERGDHGSIGRRELREQALDGVPEELFPSRDERLLIDDEHEAAAGRNVVVRAIGRRHARHASGDRRRRGRDASQRSHGADSFGDADFDVRGLQVGDRRTVGIQGDEVDGRASRTLARDLRLVRRDSM